MLDGFLELNGLLGPGVYALVYKEEVVYIGKAKRVLQRIYTHRNMFERKQAGKFIAAKYGLKVVRFTRVFVLPCRESDLDRIEKEMIAKYKPKSNQRLIPQKKTTLEDLGFDLTSWFGFKPPEQFVRRF